MGREEELVKSKLEHLGALRKSGINPYPYRFERTHVNVELQQKHAGLKAGETLAQEVSVCGRVMAKRGFGKLFFLDLHDYTGKIQVMAAADRTPAKVLELLPLIDVGDFVGARGKVHRTAKGELSVLPEELLVLSKSLESLPEKWSGLQDIEERHRKRHLDLIMNPEVRDVFLKRSKIIALVREYLEKNGFLEVEIPTLQPVYGGANARPFITKSHAWKSDFYLSISPELYLKRLLIGGYDRVYTLCKNFRNEDVDKTHNPEFTMMECYAAYWDYNDLMKLTERLFEYVALQLNGTTKITYDGKEIDLKAPWQRFTMHEALKQHAGIDVAKLSDSDLRRLLAEHQAEVFPYKRGLAIAELFSKTVEDKLIQPVFITDHPKETTPLCKLKRGNEDLIERFEPFVNGWEVANAYSELNDPILQEQFFREQAEQGVAKGENHPIDMDFVAAMRYGMPPAAGLGIGIDRLAMLLTGAKTIREVIFFPQMKPLK